MTSYSLSDLLMQRGIKDQDHNITPEVVYFSNFWSPYTKHLAQLTFSCRRRWVDNIRTDFQEVGCGYM